MVIHLFFISQCRQNIFCHQLLRWSFKQKTSATEGRPVSSGLVKFRDTKKGPYQQMTFYGYWMRGTHSKLNFNILQYYFVQTHSWILTYIEGKITCLLMCTNYCLLFKQEMEVLTQHMSVYYMIWSVTGWLSTWVVIQWII